MRDAVVLHLAFAVLAGVVLALPAVTLPSRGAVLDVALGWRLVGLVVVYNVALPLAGAARGHRDWVVLWLFLVPLSVCQVVPDAFLAGVLGVLDFPDTGGPRLGPVPLAMAGMWTIPLWLVLWGALRLSGGDLVRGALWAAALAGALLVGAEATLWAVPIWQATGVATVGPVVPEVLLGAVTWLAFSLTRSASVTVRACAASLVSLVYLGALAASFGLVEHVLY